MSDDIDPFDTTQAAAPTLSAGPAPSVSERFWANFEQAQRTGTLGGATRDALLPEIETGRARFDAYYEALPGWSTWDEGLTALAGQIGGSMTGLENYIPIGAGVRLLEAAGRSGTSIAARIFAGATDAAISNLVIDSAIQGIEIASDRRDSFSVTQLLASTALGTVAGGAFGPLTHRAPAAAADRAAPEVRPPEPVADIPSAAPTPPEAAPLAAPPPDAAPISAEPLPGGAVPAPRAPEAQPSPPVTAGAPLRITIRPEEVPPARNIDAIVSDLEALPAAKEAAGQADVARSRDLHSREGALFGELRRAVGIDDATDPRDPRHSHVGELSNILVRDLPDARAAGAADQVASLEARRDELVSLLLPEEVATAQSPTLGEQLQGLAEGRARGLDDTSVRAMSAEGSGEAFPRVAERSGVNRPAGGVAASAEPPSFVRLKELSETLRDAIAVPAVRQGRMTIKRARGTYNFDNGALRLRRQDDWETFTHEIGHAVQARFGGLDGTAAGDLAPLMKRHAGELEPMAYVGANPAHKLEEGFAEWFRLFMTTPDQAQLAAPKFAAEFRDFLAREAPDLPPVLEQVRGAYRDWIAQPSGRAVQSTIATAKRPGWVRRQAANVKRYGLGETIAENIQRAYTAIFDNLHPLQRSVRALAKIAAEQQGKPIDLDVIDDPYKLARLSRNAQSAGHMDIMHGVVPYRATNPSTASLRDAIIEAVGAPNALGRWDDAKVVEFGAYLWSRRALGEWERFEKGLIPNQPDKLTKGDHALHVQEAEAANPQFVTAAAKAHEWQLALWDKKLAAGLITPEQHADGLKIRDYVPGLRAFDYDGDPAGAVSGSRGGDAKGGYVRRFKGSTRDVINPLESMMTDAYETASAIARNDVVKALDRLARIAGHGGAAIAERIPAREMRMMLADPLEVIEAAARQSGMSGPDVIALRDMVESLVGDEPARIFRPAVINTKGETIVFFRDGGDLRALRLADREFGLDIYRALSAMGPAEKNLFLDMASLSSSALRTGITADPAFVLANLIRDQAMASIFYGSPFRRLAGTVRGMADEVLGREAARKYNAAGGIMGGQEVAALRDGAVDRDLAALRNKGWLTQRFRHADPRKWIKGIAEVTEISETGMRLGLFKEFHREAQARGLNDWEATLEAAWRARDHMDFGRRGSQMAAMSRLVPFLNASLQGFDKVSREMIEPAFRAVVTAEDARLKGEAMKKWGRLAALTVAGLGIHALMSRHDDYAEISPTTRATHWMVKTGDYWTAIPKPFELAVVLNAAEAAWDAFAEHDPLAASRYLDGLFSVIAPPNLFEGLPILKFYYEAKTNTDMFTGRPIVPAELEGMEPWLQYTAATSQIGRVVGKAINQPPVMIDQFVTSQFGSVGRTAMALSDMASGDKPTQGWDEVFLTRRFVKSASRGSASSKAFWDLVSERSGSLEGAARSWRAMMDAGDVAAADDYLASLTADKRAYLVSEMMPAPVQRLNPLIRARSAVRAIGKIRRDIASNLLIDGEGSPIDISSADRGTVDDILADLAMVEARNALIAIGEKGWQMRKPMDTDGYVRELEAVSPVVLGLLADRYATAKVWDRGLVERGWPELRKRLLEDGSDAFVKDLEGEAKAAGTELGGKRIKRRSKPAVPGQPATVD
ncbi:LPD38 domain-containing protein [Ancylobacter terrae]|uniref:LPD38 domain-containing protein n=1 Tax=Ancylobacter sp. sgz301288 TaxID=3342077 RepID=UPI00385E6EF0